jgi:hypothetical protein
MSIQDFNARSLRKSSKKSGLDQIDGAYVEVNDFLMNYDAALITESIDILQELCHTGKLQFFGIKASVAPFIYHTPAFKSSGAMATIPSFLEGQIEDDAISYCDLMIYQISPTTAVPATYPMLDASGAQWDDGLVGRCSVFLF